MKRSSSTLKTKKDGPRARGTALVLVDVINALDFPGSKGLVRAAERAAPKIERLAARARASQVPVIYVNDNFGRWRSDFKSTVQGCLAGDKPGRFVAARLRPQESDYFVLKPRHSGFYSTTLDLLLEHLQAHPLVLVGFAANVCLAFTANDAHVRGYHLVVPSDCTAAESPALTRASLAHIESVLHGDVRPSARVNFASLARGAKKRTF